MIRASLRRAQEAGSRVAADVSATLGQPIEITAGVHFERVRVVGNDCIANGAGLLAFDPTDRKINRREWARRVGRTRRGCGAVPRSGRSPDCVGSGQRRVRSVVQAAGEIVTRWPSASS